jgi:iron complex outermembrane receptor protein
VESESLSDFAGGDSVTGFDASDLEALGAQSVADIGKFTPNLEIVTTGSTTPTFFIRGIGLNDFNANAATAVAVSVDDVPLNSPGLQLGTLFDMEGVNVLRGPQGAGPSRNASAGAIKLYTRKPTGDFGGYVFSSFGNYNYMDYEGAIEAPLYKDILNSRFAFRLSERDGWMDNACGGLPPAPDRPPGPAGSCFENRSIPGNTVAAGLPTEVNSLGNWAARGTLVWEPTLDMTWTAGAHGSRRDEDSRLGQAYGTAGILNFPDGSTQVGFLGASDRGGFRKPAVEQMQRAAALALASPIGCEPNCTPRQIRIATQPFQAQANTEVAEEIADNLDIEPRKGYYDRVGPTKNDVWGVYARGDIVLPKEIELTSITGYDTYDRLIDVDLDFSPNVLFEIKTDDALWQFTQDLRFSGVLGEEAQARWEAGGIYIQETLDVSVENDFGQSNGLLVSNRDYTQKLFAFGVYAGLGFDFWEAFTLDGGFRYNWEHKSMDYLLSISGQDLKNNPSETWDAPTGTIRLTYRFREDTHAYWKYTRGWKAGHFNATSSAFKGVTAADPETIDSFEVGLRGSWFDDRVGLDLSMFYYSYENYQLFTVENDFGSLPGFVVVNADNAEVYGAEVNFETRPWEGSYFNVRGGWLESQFLDFVQDQVIQQITQNGIVTIIKEIDNTGNRLLNSPRFKVSMTAQQTLPLGRWGTLTPRYDGAWTDTTFFDPTEGRGIPGIQNVPILPDNTIGQRAYWLHNLRLAYTTPNGRIEVAGWVRNIEDKVYKNFAFDVSTFQGTTIHFLGDPRTYGVSVSLTF